MLRSPFLPRFARGAVCAAIAAAATCAPAQTSGLTAIHGAATITQSGNTTTITTLNGAGTQHSALDWTSFGVPGGSKVWFAQPDARSTSINRVLGGDPSRIDGTLGSNGRLVLVNPAGIVFGGGAVIDTAGFTASTLAMSREDAIAGRLRFGATDAGSDGEDRKASLQVQGSILARNGDVVLIGPDIETGSSAVVEANAGDVLIAAGRSVEVTGRGLEGIRLLVRAPKDQAINLGSLTGDSVAIFAGQLRHGGVIQARSVSTEGGRVVLRALEKAEVGGRIQAANDAHGGSVWMTAEKLVLKSSASVDVSHAHGGGEILVGGGWQGQDPRIANAKEVDVARGVQLRADATLSGTGGTVVVWSDRKTRYAGRISSRGAGDGSAGRVEVSSAGKLEYKGRVDVGSGPAPAGTSTEDSSEDAPDGGSTDTAQPVAANASAPIVVPMIPVQDQDPQVQAAVALPAAATAAWLDAAPALVGPERRRIVVTDAVCRLGS